MKAYVEFEITAGAYEVSCPDAQCETQGVVSIDEISLLAESSLVTKHYRYRLNRGMNKTFSIFNHNIFDNLHLFLFFRG